MWLLTADGDTGLASANQVLSPVTLELRLKDTGLRLHLLLKLRECKPGMVGEAVGMDREESSVERKGGDSHTERQGSETTQPTVRMGESRAAGSCCCSRWLTSSGFQFLGNV